MPDLINPDASSRWVFFRSKDLLIKKLGSEQQAIAFMSKEPALLLHPRYDGLNPKLEEMLTPDERRAAAAAPSGLGVSTPVLLAGVAATAAIAVVAANGLAS